MAKKKQEKETQTVNATGKTDISDISEFVEKSDTVGYLGGKSIDLSRIINGVTLESKLSSHIKDELDTELKNHEKLCRDIKKWQRQYKGRKKPKSYPWPNAANVSPPITRSNVDTTQVRLVDAIFNRRKTFIVKAKKPEMNDLARSIEDALEWLQKHILKLRQKLMGPILQQLKIGTGILHLAWESKRRVIYRYADDVDLADKSVHKYTLDGTTSKAVKDVQTTYEGPQIFPISREDFIISSDAVDIESAYLCGFRTYLRQYEIEVKEKQGVYREGTAKKILSPGKYDENKEVRAEMQNKTLEKTDFSSPNEFWTLWLKDDVDADGDVDDIVVTIHPETGTIARAIYNPVFTGNRPFVRLVGYPTEYAFDGEGMCEAIYQLQEEIDTIHNQRLDRMTLLNAFVTMSRSGVGLDSFKWSPGKHYIVDDVIEDSFKVIQVPDVYPSTFQEEQVLTGLADRVCGITPAVMGMQMAERPVFKETMSNLEESNKKFKAYIDNIRMGMTEMMYQILELMAQYSPVLTYKVEENGQMLDKSIELPIMSIRDGLEIELAASTEMISQEVRREVNTQVYGLISDFMTKTASMAQALVNPLVPPAFKKVLMEANKIGVDVVREILLDFDKNDAENLVLDLSKIILPQDMTQPPPMPPPGMPPPGGPLPGGQPGPARPQQGPPPGMMPPGRPMPGPMGPQG